MTSAMFAEIPETNKGFPDTLHPPTCCSFILSVSEVGRPGLSLKKALSLPLEYNWNHDNAQGNSAGIPDHLPRT